MCTLHARDPCRPALLCVHAGSFEGSSSQISGQVWGLEGMAGLPEGTGGGEDEMERDTRRTGTGRAGKRGRVPDVRGAECESRETQGSWRSFARSRFQLQVSKGSQ